ncbi:MAG: D-alanyl-D-alanine carboxypeptidase/D-alanyl-D-alanine-endopeptidase [Pseudomonadota bacterium]|jgi:D-alanyl-D-alanine carboxypeptidase/D-alanyl-D-alanine-endopeptidase (penicillin-binding protein 4)
MPRFFRSPAAFLGILFLVNAWSAQAQGLPPSVEQALSKAQIPLSHVAVVVQAVASSTRRSINLNSEQAMNPASVMKLVTTYSALNILGPNWRWTTRALANGCPKDGVIDGPLYLKGSGDPKFATEHLTALLRQLRSRGIKKLQGGIILDRDAFRLPALNPAQFDDFPMRPYNVGPDALLLSFHAISLTIEPQDESIQARLETPADGLRIDNQLKPGKVACDDWKDQITPQLKGSPGQWQLVLHGIFNKACGSKTLNLAPFSNNDYASLLIGAIWKELGGTLEGSVLPGSTPGNALILAEQESPPLAEIVRDINKFSNNVMARQTFLGLSENTPATLEDARSRTLTWLRLNDLNFQELVIDNGSGLSRQERISARSLARLLQHAWLSPVMPEFMSSLPIVGLDGTMRKRLTNSQSTGRGHIKTGTLTGVKSIAGYVLNQRGERFVVVFLINHPHAQQGQAAMDALLRWVIEG